MQLQLIPTASRPPSQFLLDVWEGLSEAPKRVPCKYFYDARGSQLFEDICALDEYYLTRTELAIMRRFANEMGQQIGPGVMLVEYGSGSSLKTRLLLDQLQEPVAYVPVDISGQHLQETATVLAGDYPDVEILPVCADFMDQIQLPESRRLATHAAVFFPGSTIGNLLPSEARQLLHNIAQLCGRGGGLLIGIDLQKSPQIIEAAYNDRQQVTAAFNLNLLRRINRELDGEFDCEYFQHVAFYNPELGRVEIFLESTRDQTVRVRDREFHFDTGERIHTEYSHKYTIDQFAALAAQAGLTLRKSWTDPLEHFAVLHFALL
ncbi:MAG: L-histidine N(alpha)-methyltransferase [Pirellulaceae bacterium]|nr:L-histidine N(alpha)-methyltransferase [Pirellulaceae bacterium]